MKIYFPRRSLKRLTALLGSYLLIAIFAPLAIHVRAQGTPPTDCPPAAPHQCVNPAIQTKKQAWPQGAHVNVNIDPSYQTDQRNAIANAFQNWQNAGGSSGNGSGVTFTITYNQTPLSMTPPAGTYNVQVWNRDPPRNTGLGGDNAVTDNGTNAVSQEIWINTQTTDPCALAQTAAHEIGHGFGLGECSDCAAGSSVMVGGDNGYNSTNGTYGPTSCDNSTVKSVANYPSPTQPPAGGGGDGGGGGDAGGGGYGGYCTPYYWVYFVSYDGGETWIYDYSEDAGCF
jgi:hypothetical protein